MYMTNDFNLKNYEDGSFSYTFEIPSIPQQEPTKKELKNTVNILQKENRELKEKIHTLNCLVFYCLLFIVLVLFFHH